MTTIELLQHLDAVRSRGPGRWSARCPAHHDRSPSLSVRESANRILLHCFGGCEPKEIVKTIGLEMRDLFIDSPTRQGQRSTTAPRKVNLITVGFRFEIAALDRRLRADRVLTTATNYLIGMLSEDELNRLLNAVARAYADRERAEFLETVADTFRLKAIHERAEHHAA